jgi:restriction system protein
LEQNISQEVRLLSNSSRGVWALAFPDIKPDQINPAEIVKAVRDQRSDSDGASANPQQTEELDVEDPKTWEAEMREVLLGLEPSAFERLAQRLLRESGFVQVEVKGNTGDGGIDGLGIAKVNGFLSFQVLFQCKRYQGAVTPSQIRDFRGAMQGRTDKGLFITTGTFTRDATKEATRDGAPPIDLIDGEALIQRLKELGLGVVIELVEAVTVDKAWFAKI